ncbi:MAG: chloride channel protein [Magnetovibrio sp.]|nr:chloride channel protein [Magnetovibrio sp.]
MSILEMDSNYIIGLKAIARFMKNEQLIIFIFAILIGILSGGAVIIFREAIDIIGIIIFHGKADHLIELSRSLPPWKLILIPSLSGLGVGVLIYFFVPFNRPHGVADVIEASALKGGAMSSRLGVISACISALSIGGGASVGREGPAVHLGASLASWVGRQFCFSRKSIRTLLGCGVAAAVSSSFSAPIAGALFASEVILGNYALGSLTPIVIASVFGTAVSRLYFGNSSSFTLTDYTITSFWEFPAFILLGCMCAVAAILFMRLTFLTQEFAEKTKLPVWLRPAFAGLVIGGMSIPLPEILGIGYEVAELAMTGQLAFQMMIMIGIGKIVATALCLGFGFSGGVFSPSLVIGAMTGATFGLTAATVFPELASNIGTYTIVGMGGIAAAVLGAPISTTLIIFEITGDYALSLAVLLTIVTATELTNHFFGKSFFQKQLARRNINLQKGLESEIMGSIKVATLVKSDFNSRSPTVKKNTKLGEIRNHMKSSKFSELFVLAEGNILHGTITLTCIGDFAFDRNLDNLVTAADIAQLHPPYLVEADNIETALKTMKDTEIEFIAVVNNDRSMRFLGYVSFHEIMSTYNHAILAHHQNS